MSNENVVKTIWPVIARLNEHGFESRWELAWNMERVKNYLMKNGHTEDAKSVAKIITKITRIPEDQVDYEGVIAGLLKIIHKDGE